MNRSHHDDIPDVRDGLTRLERIVLYVLHETQRELNGRAVPTAMLYGRVLECVDLSEDELQACLARLAQRQSPKP
jgi:DNA gyrase/topoisomerase IV subunit A